MRGYCTRRNKNNKQRKNWSDILKKYNLFGWK